MKKMTHTPSDIFPRGVYELQIGFKRILQDRLSVNSSKDLHEFIYGTLFNDTQIEYAELFYVLMLDRANKLYCYKLLSTGGITCTVVDIRLLFQAAILSHATSLILVHNHPSGNIKPSESDLNLTRQIEAAGKLLEILLLDHLIVGTSGVYSFADEGILG